MAVDPNLAALAAARTFCGWRVTPPEDETLELDGPGKPLLSLPTLRIVTLTSVTEDGVELDVSKLKVSKRTGNVWKPGYACWTSEPAGIEVVMNHGLEAQEALDFTAAVEQAAAGLASAADRADQSIKRYKVDDTETEWFEMASSFLNLSLLTPYRILPI